MTLETYVLYYPRHNGRVFEENAMANGVESFFLINEVKCPLFLEPEQFRKYRTSQCLLMHVF